MSYATYRRPAHALGDALGPDALGIAAQQILQNLPAGSGQSPIGGPDYPYPRDQVSVADPAYGGNRYVDYYTAFPVMDASGLFAWTGPNDTVMVKGLSQAASLAAQILMNGGDDSFSADEHPVNAQQYTAPQNTSPGAPASQDSAFITAGGSNYTPTAPPASPYTAPYTPPSSSPIYEPETDTYTVPGTQLVPASTGHVEKLPTVPAVLTLSGSSAAGASSSWSTGKKLAVGAGVGIGLLFLLKGHS